MAANQAVINSAKAAYDIPKEMYDVSGYVNGIASIAKGLIAGNEKVQLEKNKFSKTKLNTNITPVKNMLTLVKNHVANDIITTNEAINIFDGLEYTVNNTLPKIETEIQKLLSADKNGFSGSADPVLEAYIQAYHIRDWDKQVETDDSTYPQFWHLEEDTTTSPFMKMKVVGPDGTYIDPHVLLAHLQNAPRIGDGDAAHSLVSSFVGSTFKNKDIWQANVNETLGKLHSMFKNKNAKMSYLIDNTDVVDGEITSFTDYYIKNALGDIEDIKKYKTTIGEHGKLVGEKTKKMLATRLMADDPNLDADIDAYLKDIFESRKPITPGAKPKLGKVFEPSINNPADYKLFRMSRLITAGITGEDGILGGLRRR